MNLINSTKPILLVTSVLILSCKHLAEEPTTSFESLYQSHQCSMTEQTAQIISSKKGKQLYHQEISHLNKRQLGANRTPADIGSNESVFIIAMGQKSSGGYNVSVKSISASKETLLAKVDWITPAADAMTSSALTSPCEIVKIPRNYSEEEINQLTIKVIDQSGKELFQK